MLCGMRCMDGKVHQFSSNSITATWICHHASSEWSTTDVFSSLRSCQQPSFPFHEQPYLRNPAQREATAYGNTLTIHGTSVGGPTTHCGGMGRWPCSADAADASLANLWNGRRHTSSKFPLLRQAALPGTSFRITPAN